MKYLKILIFILLPFLFVGCGSIGANVSKEETKHTVSDDRVKTSLKGSEQSTQPLPLVGDIEVSGNSTVTIAQPEITPIKKTETNLDKKMDSDSFMDQSLSTIYEKHSGTFYIFLGIGLFLIVLALKSLENTKTFRAVSTLGSMIDGLKDQLLDLDSGTPEHKALSNMLRKVQAEQDRLYGKGRR
jgi:hypothetical protein